MDNSIKKNKMSRNKFNQGTKRHIRCKLTVMSARVIRVGKALGGRQREWSKPQAFDAAHPGGPSTPATHPAEGGAGTTTIGAQTGALKNQGEYPAQYFGFTSQETEVLTTPQG